MNNGDYMNANEVISIPSLPLQSAVYVVMDRTQEQVHVISRDVPSRYPLANSQLEDQDAFMNTEETEQLLQLTRNKHWRGGEDRDGFFNGAPPIDILQLLNGAVVPPSNNGLRKVMATINPYTQLIVGDSYTRSIFHPPMPETVSNYGILTYYNRDNLRVYTPDFMHLGCLFFKIEAECYIEEVKLHNGSVIGELPISRGLAQTYRDQIKDNSLDIIREAAMYHENYGLDTGLIQIMTSEDIRTWNKVVHPHLTVSDYYSRT